MALLMPQAIDVAQISMRLSAIPPPLSASIS